MLFKSFKKYDIGLRLSHPLCNEFPFLNNIDHCKRSLKPTLLGPYTEKHYFPFSSDVFEFAGTWNILGSGVSFPTIGVTCRRGQVVFGGSNQLGDQMLDLTPVSSGAIDVRVVLQPGPDIVL